jgi:hypothetical protein
MRSFEERISEINRRSEKIIKERKKRRKYILSACIPVVLCLSLWLAWPEPKAATENHQNSTGAINSPMEEPDSERYVLKVEVFAGDFYRYHTDEAKAVEIFDQLNGFGETEDINCAEPTEPIFNDGLLDDTGNYGTSAPVPETPVDDAPIINKAPIRYIITLQLQNGQTLEYVLRGNTLKNQTTNQEIILSDKEASRLRALLEIPPTS